jgi:hypothetical protein
MVNYTTTTLNKQGTLTDGDVTYNVNVTAVNNELTRLNCSISKKIVKKYPDGNGGYVENQEDTYIGNITLEHGRKVIEIIQDESIIQHLTTFQGILDEVLGKPQTT